jgi:hypothetical protein
MSSVIGALQLKLWYFINLNRSCRNFNPVNLALLQHFFDESRLSHILGNTTFSNPVNIFLPNFTIYKNKMDHIAQ